MEQLLHGHHDTNFVKTAPGEPFKNANYGSIIN